MKLTKFWASALGLFALASCSKDAEPNQPVEQPTTKVVHIDLTAGQDDAGLRATYGVKTDGTGMLTGLQMSDKNVILRVAVRRGTGTPVIQDLTFTKSTGRNHASYSGQITVPTGGEGDYEISAILMSEVDGETFLTTPVLAGTPNNAVARLANQTAVVLPSDGRISLGVPYTSKWQKITISSNNVVNPVTLAMKPYGTVLRMRIKNEHAADKTFYSVRFLTNMFSKAGDFYFNRSYDNMPAWIGGTLNTVNFDLPTGGVMVPGTNGGTANYSPWMYVWLAPHSGVISPETTGLLTLSNVGTGNEGLSRAFYTQQPLPLGSVPVTLVYSGSNHDANFGDLEENQGEWGGSTTPVSPLERVASYALNKTADGFVSDQHTRNEEVGYFTYAQATALSSPLMIDGVAYSLPTRDEMASIFPVNYNAQGHNIFNLGVYYHDVVEPNIKLGTITQSYRADYYRADLALYAIRFISDSNRNRTAFRYRPISLPDATRGGNSVILVVETVHLGNQAIALEDITSSTFWNARNADIVRREFPAYGQFSFDNIKEVFNRSLFIWTSTPSDALNAYVGSSYVPDASSTWVRSFPMNNKLPIFLFKRN